MYAWIDAEKWDGDGQPPLTEHHGLLVAPSVTEAATGRATWYGKILNDQDELVVARALLQSRLEFVPRRAEDQD